MSFLPDLSTRLDHDEAWAQLATGADVSFALGVRDGDETTIAVGEGSDRDVDFRVVLQRNDWDELLAPDVEPRKQHPLAFLEPRGSGAVLGDKLVFAQHLHLVRRAIEVARNSDPPPPAASRDLTGISGRYLPVHVNGWGHCDVYVEAAGAGRPVVLLHTAGADGRQYHGLLSDPRLTAAYQLFAFDLPWHGRSNPAHGSRSSAYRLTSQTYTDCIAAVIGALQLSEPPIIVGASMAGAVVIETVALHPDKIAGAVSCQAGPRVGNRHTPYLRNNRVNQTVHVPEWTYGLMSPQSPEQDRDRVWWGYSQGGWGVYERDITYYSEEWDIDNVAHLLGTHTPPVVLMNGQYDYSVPPAATEELLARIPGSTYRPMPELGHFPHAENPPVFADHLLAALDHISQQIPA